MATTTVKKGQPGSRAWFRDSFVLHKLHSLSGVFPIGFFMIQHLLANSYSLRGEKEFNTVVSVFGYLPFVAVMEWVLIFIPLLFHSIYGFFITAEMRANVGVYQYSRNWLYLLQRISGIVAFLYIGYHTYSTWGIKKMYELAGGDRAHEMGFRSISYDAMLWRFEDPLYVAIYVLGISMSAFHLANGLFNFGIRWGITIGATAQKVSGLLWSGVGIALLLIGVGTALNFHIKSKNFENTGRSVRAQYATLDALVNSEDAPASPLPGSKPESTGTGLSPGMEAPMGGAPGMPMGGQR